MGLFSFEHSKAAYAADFILYSGAIGVLLVTLMYVTPLNLTWMAMGYGLLGLAAWSVIEYVLHRFVLHGLEPFKGWHIAHHQRPSALMGTPTVLSATLFVLLVYLPTWWMAGLWRASALTMGLLMGYLVYSLAHHAMHHRTRQWPGLGIWLRHHRHWHAKHHQSTTPCCYGVTSSLWDHVFASAQTAGAHRTTTKH